MLTNTTAVRPYGSTTNEFSTSVMHIANISEERNKNHYVVVYYEKGSYYTPNGDAIVKTMVVHDWDRVQPSFALMERIYSNPNKWLTREEFTAIYGDEDQALVSVMEHLLEEAINEMEA